MFTQFTSNVDVCCVVFSERKKWQKVQLMRLTTKRSRFFDLENILQSTTMRQFLRVKCSLKELSIVPESLAKNHIYEFLIRSEVTPN